MWPNFATHWTELDRFGPKSARLCPEVVPTISPNSANKSGRRGHSGPGTRATHELHTGGERAAPLRNDCKCGTIATRSPEQQLRLLEVFSQSLSLTDSFAVREEGLLRHHPCALVNEGRLWEVHEGIRGSTE